MTSWARPSGASGRSARWRAPGSSSSPAPRAASSPTASRSRGSPQTSASAAFQDQTATGKLKAEMIAHGPSGCQVSVMRWPGRSEAMARPYNWRDRPTAKSQMSIISCTSPRPSETILPTSSVTSAPKASFAARNSSPSRRTSSPRRGAGNLAPGEEGAVGALDDRRHVGCRRLPDPRDLGPVDRRADRERAARQRRRCQTQALENVSAGHGGGPHPLRFACSPQGPEAPACDASLRPQIRPPGKPRLGPGLASDW